MKTICGWCKVKYKDDGTNDGIVSHGMCKSCFKVEMQKIDEMKKKNGTIGGVWIKNKATGTT